MKIIYNIAGLFNAGGMERVLTNKANYLAGLGYEVIILTTDQKNRKPYFDLKSCVKHLDLGINYAEIQDLGLFFKAVAYWNKQRLHERRMRTLLNELEADVVICMFDHDVSFLHKIEDGSKKVLEIHFSRFKRLQYGRKGLWRVVDRQRSDRDLRLAKKYDRFVVLTKEDKGYWGDLNNIVVIPNANSFLTDTTAELSNKVAIAVGRYDYQKGFDDLIKIWAMVQPGFPDWQLKIYGAGEMETEMRKMIEDLNLEQYVFLCEPVRNIKEAYLSSSVYLMTSRYEGLPMALLEAQSCGLPLLSYACKCGPRDIIEEGRNGYLVKQDDMEEFVRRLREMLSREGLRKAMGEQGKDMSQHFSEEVVMKQWIKLFEEVLNESMDVTAKR
ncbi:glycosyltransferase family 4 protein [Sphingobacterium faecale]|uniref:Glycosyltransferase family 4 protein n=1 Tax=Sphingobacterium faecale TaxID=2803775 RepID=A0ABS1QXY0_9SPHI|nr:glycosyltransferase family 4 protein [Sphingobacterium faecale]MBL1407273.1 glycosyltransferase family 4 protein [Sphingobacterium faecale]